jgi:hypothetical protein
MLLGEEKTSSNHLLYGALPVNYATANVFKQLQEKYKAARNTRACDYLNLLLLLQFILSNLFREEADERNRRHCGTSVVESSEKLIGVSNIFLRWYKLFHQTTLGIRLKI